MGLWERIRALRKDVAQAERDKALEGRWRRELAAALKDAGHVNHALPTVRDGIDCLAPFPANQCRPNGITFVCRYLSAVTEEELEDYAHHGIDVVAVFESGARRALDGNAAGAADARYVERRMRDLKIPAGRPCYFTCDTEVAGAGLAAVRQYVAGAADVLGWHRVGIYGSYTVVEHLHSLNACQFFWQTLAWSSGNWSGHANLRQLAIEQVRAGRRVDLDRAYTADFGQWRV